MGEGLLPKGFDPRIAESEGGVLSGLNQALKEGHRLRVFRIGSEIRAVLRQEDLITGLETGGPSTDRVLMRLSKNYQTRCSSVHGYFEDIKDFKMTSLDKWMHEKEPRIDAYVSEDGLIAVDLVKEVKVSVPDYIWQEAVKKKRSVIWKDKNRGYVYEVSSGLIKVIARDKKRREGEYTYEQAKRGRGDDFSKALAAAFETEPQDISPWISE